jgi:hypothetical protein
MPRRRLHQNRPPPGEPWHRGHHRWPITRDHAASQTAAGVCPPLTPSHQTGSGASVRPCPFRHAGGPDETSRDRSGRRDRTGRGRRVWPGVAVMATAAFCRWHAAPCTRG